MSKIRYKYTPAKEGVQLDKIKCPTCGNPINWVKSSKYWTYDGGKPLQMLLAECWSGDTEVEKPEHLFLIQVTGLPIVEVDKV
jgi:hypothetical protein